MSPPTLTPRSSRRVQVGQIELLVSSSTTTNEELFPRVTRVILGPVQLSWRRRSSPLSPLTRSLGRGLGLNVGNIPTP